MSMDCIEVQGLINQFIDDKLDETADRLRKGIEQ